ncbi:MAG: glucose-6-phosphate dehydrogenase assembly protein OpcA [Armatimonadetes bacterium]|nr:glucose-6-phosphate dehydrogenase assembly protein OpcA [Armatimonadota bacterium]
MKPDWVREHVISGEARPLKIGNVTRALADYWREHRNQHEDSCLRVCTMNLVVVTSEPSGAAGLGARLKELAPNYPCRSVLVVRDPETEGDLTGWLSPTCIPAKEHQAGSEQLIFHAPGGGERIPSLVLPLLRPDLPVFLYWIGGPPFGANFFERLVEGSSRVLFDSATFPFTSALTQVLELVQDRYHCEQAFSDLSWGRLATWRQLVAALFDSPGAREQLGKTRRVEVQFWTPGEVREFAPGPLLMAGWLASRLKWRSSGSLQRADGVWESSLASEGGPIRLRLIPVANPDPELEGRLVGVTLACDGCTFSVHRQEEDLQKMTSVVDGLAVEIDHQLRLQALDEAHLLGREFEQLSRDPVFESSLRSALELGGYREVARA